MKLIVIIDFKEKKNLKERFCCGTIEYAEVGSNLYEFNLYKPIRLHELKNTSAFTKIENFIIPSVVNSIKEGLELEGHDIWVEKKASFIHAAYLMGRFSNW